MEQKANKSGLKGLQGPGSVTEKFYLLSNFGKGFSEVIMKILITALIGTFLAGSSFAAVAQSDFAGNRSTPNPAVNTDVNTPQNAATSGTSGAVENPPIGGTAPGTIGTGIIQTGPSGPTATTPAGAQPVARTTPGGTSVPLGGNSPAINGSGIQPAPAFQVGTTGTGGTSGTSGRANSAPSGSIGAPAPAAPAASGR
jgi:hypothetical protein